MNHYSVYHAYNEAVVATRMVIMSPIPPNPLVLQHLDSYVTRLKARWETLVEDAFPGLKIGDTVKFKTVEQQYYAPRKGTGMVSLFYVPSHLPEQVRCRVEIMDREGTYTAIGAGDAWSKENDS